MPTSSRNVQLFALRSAPPDELTVRGRRYGLAKVFKHDFFAATSLYEAVEPVGRQDRLVVKLGREQAFCGLPMSWIGEFLCSREQAAHAVLDGIPGVQRWAARLSETGYALEYVEGRTLDAVEEPPPERFFVQLREMVDAIHARGAAYCDLNKRSNIVVRPDGSPALIDFQITVVAGAGWAWRLVPRGVLRYLQRMDMYHLYKHKRRLTKSLTAEEAALAERPGALVNLHRALVTPIRMLRRRFLTRQHRSGRLVSPTSDLESHSQPEKETWRK